MSETNTTTTTVETLTAEEIEDRRRRSVRYIVDTNHGQFVVSGVDYVRIEEYDELRFYVAGVREPVMSVSRDSWLEILAEGPYGGSA
ncbi:hypothetical protein AXA44_15470 [Rhodococcus sp. SC4]|nr:hypothetical protein AXA44_15470 [Rhodococcus sp. SC4]